MCLFPNYVLRETFTVFDGFPIVTNKFVGRHVNEYLQDDELVHREYISVPCGKCVECLQQYSDEWSFRIVRECSFHQKNCMLTLTYADNPVSICKRDVQLFVKSLRKALSPLRIRFFACGEYGAKGKRPHYHLIIFGWFPDDCEFFFSRNGHSVYKSDFVARVWKRGFISVEEVTLDSARYCAKYLQKLQHIPAYLQQPFTLMSNKPGIGFSETSWSFLATDKLYHHGKYISTPRYYLRKAEEYGADISSLKEVRQLKAEFFNSQYARRFAKARKIANKFGENFIKPS